MWENFHLEDTEAVLLVDASNVFNSLNRMSALHYIRLLCPSISNILINCYRTPTKLFIDGDALYSREGTTQGDPLGMPMYALATVPLINKLLHSWWKSLSKMGLSYGYHVNASKTWLVVKKEFLFQAEAIFGDTQVQITSEGRPPRAPLGRPEYVAVPVAALRWCKWVHLHPVHLSLHPYTHLPCICCSHLGSIESKIKERFKVQSSSCEDEAG